MTYIPDLCGYLEEEAESAAVQDFVDNLLQSEIVDSGIVEDIRTEDRKEKRKPKDPRIIMELRHKQVKKHCFCIEIPLLEIQGDHMP